MYIWETSLPRKLKEKKGGEKLVHATRVQGPRSTLEFLQQTQKYIHDITKQSQAKEQKSARRSGNDLPRIRRSKNPSLGVERKSQGQLNAAQRFTESLPTSGKESPMSESGYKITQYVLAAPLSPRLTVSLPRLPGLSRPVRSQHFTNAAIESFLNRFDAPRTTKSSFGISVNVLR